jgi:tripartite-type tricarboxylate transporter receptor subunit TctC
MKAFRLKLAAMAVATYGLSCTMFHTPLQAQTYPERPIRVIVSIAAGSVTDVIVRMMDKELAPKLGQPMVIENRGGASGILAAQACKAAPPDGYTLCVIYHSTLSYNPYLFNKLPYDADKDFALITRLFFLVEGLAVPSALGINSVADLKAQALAKPEAFNFGTLGAGSFPELFLKWVNNQWNTKIAAVPFRGGGPIAQALAAGDLQIGNMGLGNFMPLVQGGKVKLLAVMAPKRLPMVPDVPTFEEAGLGAYQARGWWGLAAPAGTPRPIIDRLNAAFTGLLRDPKFMAQLEGQATIAAPTTPEEFAAFLQSDRKAAQELIKIANTPRTDYKPE